MVDNDNNLSTVIYKTQAGGIQISQITIYLNITIIANSRNIFCLIYKDISNQANNLLQVLELILI